MQPVARGSARNASALRIRRAGLLTCGSPPPRAFPVSQWLPRGHFPLTVTSSHRTFTCFPFHRNTSAPAPCVSVFENYNTRFRSLQPRLPRRASYSERTAGLPHRRTGMRAPLSQCRSASRTSSSDGIDGAAPLRETEIADAFDASSMHSFTGRPAKKELTK